MKIQIEVLRRALDALLDHTKEQHGESVEIDADLYWFVPEAAVNDPTVDPTGHTLGSLEDDLAEISAIARGEKEPIGYGLVWASSLLRAMGDRTP